MNTVLFSWFTHACISIGQIIRACVSLPSVDKFNSVPSLLHYLSLPLIVCESSNCQLSFLMVRSLFTRAQGMRSEKAMAPHSSTLAWKNPMGRGGWQAVVHGVAKSRTRLSDFTFTFSLSYIGEGNGNPLQCSCLENPRDGGAWWAAVHGITQSRT